MRDDLRPWFDGAEGPLARDLALRLGARTGSVFCGSDASAGEVAARAAGALRRDIVGGAQTAMRELLTELLAVPGVTFADLKLLATALRQGALAAMQAAPLDEAAREAVEAWMFQFGLLTAQRFVAERERMFHEHAAQLEVRQLEHQLSELTAAFAEKSRLLELIRQASTPIAPVHDGILVVPLVGVFDSERAQLLTAKLLAGIGEARAQVVILDVSGVPVFDAEAAHHLVRTSSAVRLLGAQLIVVGLTPATARTIIELGLDLSGLTTLGTLQAGLDRALSLRRLRIVGA